MTTTKHTVKKTEDKCVYEYRGIRIERNDSNRGYWGHWSTEFGMRRPNGKIIKVRAETLRGLKSEIDSILDSKNVE